MREENVILQAATFDADVQIVPGGDFELALRPHSGQAWLEYDSVYAVLGL